MINILKKIALKVSARSEEKREVSLLARKAKEIVKAEKLLLKSAKKRTEDLEMFKMLELSLKYGVPVRRVERDGKRVWIIEVEE